MLMGALQKCEDLTFEGGLPFLDRVSILRDIGIRSYYTDLVQRQTIFYSRDGKVTTLDLPLKCTHDVPLSFSALEIRNVIAAQDIGYEDFLCSLMTAGCVSYSVFFDGRIVYFGKNSKFHMEHFNPHITPVDGSARF